MDRYLNRRSLRTSKGRAAMRCFWWWRWWYQHVGLLWICSAIYHMSRRLTSYLLEHKGHIILHHLVHVWAWDFLIRNLAIGVKANRLGSWANTDFGSSTSYHTLAVAQGGLNTIENIMLSKREYFRWQNRLAVIEFLICWASRSHGRKWF